ncbi:MAG: hypothetical protein GYA17_05880 [Chloroflexi bacterium]|jgi:hypothetical protein|nr:hypothetical protein [Anaerolineaceae bacterium]NMB87867.1 hypothetical protein [Chloroflexota bacterium]
MNTANTLAFVPSWQDRLGRGLMWLSALGALAAFGSGLASVRTATADTVWLETWRMFGFLVFTGMFVLLALRPRRSAGVWELAFLHKAAMAISALVLVGANEAAMAGAIDAVLAVLIALAYGLTRGWRAWRGGA